MRAGNDVSVPPHVTPLASELEGPRRAVPLPTVTDRESFTHAGPTGSRFMPY